MRQIYSFLFSMVLGVLMPVNIFAQDNENNKKYVSVEIADDVTLQPIRNAKVTILWAKDSTLIAHASMGESQRGNRVYASVSFYISKTGDYIAKCEAPGYETTYNNFSIKKFYKHESFIDLDKPFYIKRLKKKKEHQLGEVTVRATKVKFYYKGDTVVYNADAFELAEGSMLDALIKQLPGAELKDDGEITVNGRRVDELLLNGRDFLNSDRKVMLQNLPTYMVKNIKVFEKDDLLRQRAGDKNAKNFAMDVRLKKEYSIGLIGNAEVGAGTDDRFLGRLFGLRFTPNSALTFYGNTNNLSDDRIPGDRGDWTPLQQPTGVTKVYVGGLKYQYQGHSIQYDGDIKATHSDGKRRSYASSEQFLPANNIFERSFANSNSHNTSISTHNQLWITKERVLGRIKLSDFRISPFLEYNHYSNNAKTASAQADTDIFPAFSKQWRDSITATNISPMLLTHGLNRVLNNSKENGHSIHTGTKWGTNIGIAHDERLGMILSGELDFTNSKTHNYEHYNLQYFQTGNTDFRNRFTRNSTTGFRNDVTLRSYNIYLFNNYIDISPKYTFTFQRQSQSRSLYLLNKLDAWDSLTNHPLGELPSVDEMLLALDHGNTYHQRETNELHTLGVLIRFGNNRGRSPSNNLFIQSDINPSLRIENDKMHYLRNTTDTTFHRHLNTFTVSSNTSILKSLSSGYLPWRITIRYNLSIQAPNMTYLVDYRDDSDPLNVMLGNRHLKNTHTHTFGLSFNRNMKKQRILETSLGAHIFTHRLSMGYVYDRETGVRTVTPDNVNGNWDISGKLKYSARLDKDGRFTYSTQTDANYLHSVDLIGEDGATASSRSKVNTTYLNEALKLNMRLSSKATINLLADLHYQHSSSSRKNFSTINIYDFDYGLGGIFSLPWKLKLSTDLTMYSRRGYSDHSMNTNEPVWNARLSRPFWNGRLTVMLDAFDLLNELSNVRRTINAQGRTETWNNM